MSDIRPTRHRFEEKGTKSSDEKRRAEKIVKGTVKTKQKNGINKITDVFIAEDVNNVKSYVLLDVLVPTIKKAIVDIITDGVHMIFLGGTGKGGRRASDYTSYSKYSDNRRDERRYNDSRARTGFDYEDIIFDNRGEADKVLYAMDEMMDQYGLVRVADMYDLAGLSSPYTANDYGWTNIRNAEIKRVRDGYIIKMPRAIPMK